MDIDDLGHYLKLAPVTLYKMVKEGKIPCRRIGKSLRFPKEMIDQWLLQGETEKTVPSLIRTAVSQFASRVRDRLGTRAHKILLYGSWAHNKARVDSDIDIAVIVDKKDLALTKAIGEIASDVSLETDRFLSVVVVESQVHQRGVSEGYPFHRQVEQESLPL